MRKERWIFTEKELEHPEGCTSTDIFIATPDGFEIGVQVYRNGKVTNNWADGTAGVPERCRRLAFVEDTLTTPDGMEYADAWRNVKMKDGKFVNWDLTTACQ